MTAGCVIALALCILLGTSAFWSQIPWFRIFIFLLLLWTCWCTLH